MTKFRALLPLTNNMEPYILGDFKEMQVRDSSATWLQAIPHSV